MKFLALFGSIVGMVGCGTGSPVRVDCREDRECDDGDPATDERCWEHRCYQLVPDQREQCAFDGECDDGDDATAEVCLYGTCVSRLITGHVAGALVLEQPFGSVDSHEERYALLGDENVLLGRYPVAAFDEDIKLSKVPLLFRTLTAPTSIQNIRFAVDRETHGTSEVITSAPGEGEIISARLRDLILPVATSRDLLLVADVPLRQDGIASGSRLLPAMPNLPDAVQAVGLWSGAIIPEDQVNFPGGDLISWTTVVVAARPEVALSPDVSCEEASPIEDQIIGAFELRARTHQSDGEVELVGFTLKISSNIVTRAPRQLRVVTRSIRGDEQIVFIHAVPAGETVGAVAVPPEALAPVVVRSLETKALLVRFDLQDARRGSFLDTALADLYWSDAPGEGEIFGPLSEPLPACELNW